MVAKTTSILKRSIALMTLWIFLCSDLSFALRPRPIEEAGWGKPVAKKDRVGPAVVARPVARVQQLLLEQQLSKLQRAETVLTSLRRRVGRAARGIHTSWQRKLAISLDYNKWTPELLGVLNACNLNGAKSMPNLVTDGALRSRVMTSDNEAVNYLGQLEEIIFATLRIVEERVATVKQGLAQLAATAGPLIPPTRLTMPLAAI